jgi:moderate conductance mechanosensitive channel
MKEYLIEWYDNLIPWLLTHGIKIVVILIGSLILNRVIHRLIDKAVRLAVVPDGDAPEDNEKKREDTLIQIFSTTAKIVLFLMAALMILHELGVMIGPILAGAGIVGLAFGFGGQYLIRDIISGLFIIIENQYRIGDVVRFDTVGGKVEAITLRMTTLRDLDGVVHHVPHGEIKTVSNLSKEFSRVNMNIGIAYHSDIDKVIEVINKTGQELAEDIVWKEAIITPPQFLRVDEFGDSAITIKITGDTKPHKQWEVSGEFRKRIKKAFDKEGIEIPFPQRVIHQSK